MNISIIAVVWLIRHAIHVRMFIAEMFKIVTVMRILLSEVTNSKVEYIGHFAIAD